MKRPTLRIPMSSFRGEPVDDERRPIGKRDDGAPVVHGIAKALVAIVLGYDDASVDVEQKQFRACVRGPEKRAARHGAVEAVDDHVG